MASASSPYPSSPLSYQTFAPPSRSNTFIAMSMSSAYFSTPTPTPTPIPAGALPSYNSVGQSTDPWGVVWKNLTSEGDWSRVIPHTGTSSSSSTGAPASSTISAAVDGLSGPPPSYPNGLGLPALVGISVSSVLVLVAVITGCCWVRHRRNKEGRRDARQMREIGVERIGAWTFEQPPAAAQRNFARIPSPTNSLMTLPRYPDQLRPNHTVPHRQSTTTSAGTSAWEDDSELDMLATDGSTLARTLSTRSISSLSTIRTLQSSGDRERLDHPGYTYRSNTVTSGSRSRSTPGSTFVSSSSQTGGLSPFADPGSSVSPTSNVPSSTGISPITPLPRAAHRLSTASSNNPFADALPVYSIEETTQEPVNPFVDRLGGDMGVDRARVSDPPAYRDLYRR